MKHVIKTMHNAIGREIVEYVGKGTYRVNKEKYVVLVGNNITEAKTYSSFTRADNAFKRLSETCVNLSNCDYEIIRLLTDWKMKQVDSVMQKSQKHRITEMDITKLVKIWAEF